MKLVKVNKTWRVQTGASVSRAITDKDKLTIINDIQTRVVGIISTTSAKSIISAYALSLCDHKAQRLELQIHIMNAASDMVDTSSRDYEVLGLNIRK